MVILADKLSDNAVSLRPRNIFISCCVWGYAERKRHLGRARFQEGRLNAETLIDAFASSYGLVWVVVQIFTRLFRLLLFCLKWGLIGLEAFPKIRQPESFSEQHQGPLEEVMHLSDYLKCVAGV